MVPEEIVRPRALGPGSRVALVAPAGPLAPEAVARAEERVRALGWVPVTGPHVRGDSRANRGIHPAAPSPAFGMALSPSSCESEERLRTVPRAAGETRPGEGASPPSSSIRRAHLGYLSAPDADRLADLQAAINSGEIDGIWCLRGGYGTMRIMDALDLSPLRERPRPLIGFSDNTVLHLLAARAGVISFHGPHPAAELTEFSLNHLLGMVTGAAVSGGDAREPFPLPEGAEPPVTLVSGTATGRLVGGNLALLAATVGTRAQLDAAGAILAIEDVGEPLYRIDRMLTQLRCAGVLDGVAGIMIGAFSRRPDEGDATLPSLAELFADRLGDLGVPVVCGLPFGHIPDSWTLPMGAKVTLNGDEARSSPERGAGSDHRSPLGEGGSPQKGGGGAVHSSPVRFARGFGGPHTLDRGRDSR